jgi:eukaryotic-like serine/threonine-protein kinase
VLAQEVRSLLAACAEADVRGFLLTPSVPVAEAAVAEWRRNGSVAFGGESDAWPGARGGAGRHARPDASSLAPGTVVGAQYVIEALAGRGGMASVYRAHDRKHARTVALKLMHTGSSHSDGDRAAREIHLTARLQHSGIVPLFDSGSIEGHRWFVMPFVEGESLADRLRRGGPLSVRESVRVARAVCEALAYAHREGVVHRDLKPGNILLRDGVALVSDFGIAHAGAGAGDDRGIGTPGFMSPEQITGSIPADARTDVFALGCVLFAMLTGTSPFAGGNKSEVIARTLTGATPSMRSLRREVPTALASVVSRALAADPSRRPASAAAFLVLLDDATRERAGRTRRTAGVLASVLAIAVITNRSAPPERVARFVLPQGGASPIGDGGGVLMPDGRTVVFVSGDSVHRQVFLRPIDSLEARPVQGTEGAVSAFVAPDGRWIGFVDEDDALRIVRREGGVSRRLTSTFRFSAADWSPTGTIVFWRFDPRDIAWISPEGGAPHALTTLDTAHRETRHIMPRVLDGGRLVGFIVQRDRAGPGIGIGELAVIRLDTMRATPDQHARLGIEGSAIIGLVDDWLVYVPPRALTIQAIRFDVRTLRTSGRPVDVLADRSGGISAPVLSADGTLLYTRREMTTLPVIRAPDGGEDTLPVPAGSTAMNPRLSADGTRLLLQVSTANGTDAWEVDVARRTGRFVSRTGRVVGPTWLSANEFTYLDVTNVGAIWRQVADSTDVGRRMFASPGAFGPEVVASRGLVVYQRLIDGVWSIWAASINGSAPPRQLVRHTGHAFLPAVSPDGRWLAYTRVDEGGQSVWLRPFDGDSTSDQRLDAATATEPRWAPEGTRLIMRSLGRLVSVELRVDTGAAVPRVRRVIDLGADEYAGQMPHSNFDVLPRNRGLITLRRRPNQPASIVVLDWRSELRRRLRAAS